MSTAQQRLDDAIAIVASLEELISDDELHTYGHVIEHLHDYVSALEIDLEREQG